MSQGALHQKYPLSAEPFDYRVEELEEQLKAKLRASRRASIEGWCRYQGRVMPFAAAWAGDDLHLWLDGHQFIFQAVERRGRDRSALFEDDAPASARGMAGANDPKRVVAPMAGRVLIVRVRPGDSVSAGDELCVLEAMKMENSIKATAGGVVKAVHVEQGQQVLSGKLLVEMV
ncbi:MAG: acetyl-CoA carboxylase biotin carboxyl carrier protein subunit [Chloroflexi bacterium]|nr:acetyl-CoA carboxylase biotin carboxyl carrier protein subunit [Chloroflexota bacterium]